MSAPMQHIFPLRSLDFFKFHEENASVDVKLLQNTKVAISGKFQTLTTSLLQQAAVSYSSAGKPVTFIRLEPLADYPLPVHGMYRMNYATVQNITYLYMSSTSDLIEYLCSINNAETDVPKAVIVDTFDLYVSQLQFGSEVSIAKMCSLLLDTVEYLQERYGEDIPVLISITDTLAPHLHVYNHYLNLYSVEQVSGSNGENIYTLDELQSKDATPSSRLTFSIDKHNIILRTLEVVHT